jgi:N-acetylglutamate synthase
VGQTSRKSLLLTRALEFRSAFLFNGVMGKSSTVKPPRFRLEPMLLSDFKEVLRLWQNSEGVGLNESDTRPAIAQYLARNPGMSFVARHGKEIVGAVLCGHDGRRGYLHHLAVAREHRRQGLGKRLVDACLGELKRLRIFKCNIFLYADNEVGERFWENSGWAPRADLQVLQKAVLPSKSKRCC